MSQEKFKFRIVKAGFYISKKRTPTFVYGLKSKSDEALNAYKDAKGEAHLRIDEETGNPLFYSANRPLINATLVMRINDDGVAKFHTTAEGGRLPLVTDEELKYFALSEGGHMEKLITEKRFRDIVGGAAPAIKEEQDVEEPSVDDSKL